MFQKSIKNSFSLDGRGLHFDKDVRVIVHPAPANHGIVFKRTDVEDSRAYVKASFENVSKLLYFKLWEHAGLPYSFYQHYSAHEKKDYFIKDSWKEHLKERCIYPANFFQLGYEF